MGSGRGGFCSSGCAMCCLVWSAFGVLILCAIGALVALQPEYVPAMSPETLKHPKTQAGHLFGGAACYFGFAVLSVVSLLRDQQVSNTKVYLRDHGDDDEGEMGQALLGNRNGNSLNGESKYGANGKTSALLKKKHP